MVQYFCGRGSPSTLSTLRSWWLQGLVLDSTELSSTVLCCQTARTLCWWCRKYALQLLFTYLHIKSFFDHRFQGPSSSDREIPWLFLKLFGVHDVIYNLICIRNITGKRLESTKIIPTHTYVCKSSALAIIRTIKISATAASTTLQQWTTAHREKNLHKKKLYQI